MRGPGTISIIWSKILREKRGAGKRLIPFSKNSPETKAMI